MLWKYCRSASVSWRNGEPASFKAPLVIVSGLSFAQCTRSFMSNHCRITPIEPVIVPEFATIGSHAAAM